LLGIVLLTTFIAACILVLVIFSVVKRGLEQYEDKYATKGTKSLEDMFFFVTTRQVLMLTVAISSVFFLLGFLIFNLIMGLILAAFGFVFPFVGIRYLRKRRIHQFEKQLVDALTQMSAAFKAGLTLPQAAENISQEIGPPAGQEFSLFIRELKLGVPMEEALVNMSGRVGSDDLDLVGTSTNISRQLGGNMAEMYDIISATIRERFRLEGRIRALTSQGKLQGWVVACMPVALGLFLNWWRPDLMKPMLAHPFGWGLIGVIALMLLLGVLLIRRIVNIDV
jgi:tight adherence protein B